MRKNIDNMKKELQRLKECPKMDIYLESLRTTFRKKY